MATDLKLAPLFQRVQRPGRYAGAEWNATVKEPAPGGVTVALCSSGVYETGMSNLEYQTLYQLLNAVPRVTCERAFTPWADMAAAMREGAVPLFTLEGKRPVASFDIVLFFLGDETGYTNVLECLDLAGLPLRAGDRDRRHPIVMAAGSRVLNPEPLYAFIDLFLLGEPEEAALEAVQLALEMKDRAGGQAPQREAFLAQASLRPGLYTPSLYRPVHGAGGTPAGIEAVCRRLPERVWARLVPKLGPPLVRPVVPYLEVADDRGLVEVQRSCGGFCRGCAAGGRCAYLRQRHAAEVVSAIEALVQQCGHREFALRAPEAADYAPWLDLLRMLRAKYPGPEYLFLPPALGTEATSAGLGAEEGHPERLAASAEAMFRLGGSGARVRCVLGRPGEGTREVERVLALAAALQEAGVRALGRRPRIRVGADYFAPRPHAASERSAMPPKDDLDRLHASLRKGLRKLGAQLFAADPDATFVQTALAMGDRRAGEAIEQAWRMGCAFEGGGQRFELARWAEAFRLAGLDLAWYASRSRPADEVLPWAHIVPPGAEPVPGPAASVGRRCAAQPCPVCRYLDGGPEPDERSGRRATGAGAG